MLPAGHHRHHQCTHEYVCVRVCGGRGGDCAQARVCALVDSLVGVLLEAQTAEGLLCKKVRCNVCGSFLDRRRQWGVRMQVRVCAGHTAL